MMFQILALVCFLAPSALWAQGNPRPKTKTQDSPISLVEKARQETLNTGIQSQKASEIEIGRETVFLQLKDPGLTIEASPWIWNVGLRLQRFAPSGTATMRNGQNLNLSALDATTLPLVEVGSFYKFEPRPHGIWSLGASLEGGLSSQNTHVIFPSGAEADNSRFSTSLLGLSLMTTYRHHRLPRAEALAGWTQGTATYSHSSQNDGANFSASIPFSSWRLGLYYEPTRHWLVGIEESARFVRSENGIDLPRRNTSFSTRILW